MNLDKAFDGLIGIPFKSGGRDPKEGLDCWGLVLVAYKRFNIELPDFGNMVDALNSFEVNLRIKSSKKFWEQIQQPEIPSVLAIRNHPKYVNHCGVYVGNHRFLHCLEKVGVILSNMSDRIWQRRIEGIYRYVP